jgi:hypothetical protein
MIILKELLYDHLSYFSIFKIIRFFYAWIFLAHKYKRLTSFIELTLLTSIKDHTLVFFIKENKLFHLDQFMLLFIYDINFATKTINKFAKNKIDVYQDNFFPIYFFGINYFSIIY